MHQSESIRLSDRSRVLAVPWSTFDSSARAAFSLDEFRLDSVVAHSDAPVRERMSFPANRHVFFGADAGRGLADDSQEHEEDCDEFHFGALNNSCRHAAL